MDSLNGAGAAGLWALGLFLLAGQLAAHELGYWLARREKATRANAEPVGVVVAGMLGLLGFVLALTLSFANTRYTEARNGALAEASAVGGAWLRARAVGGEEAEEVARLFERYAATREAFVRAGPDPALIERLNRQTDALQAEIWEHVTAIVRARSDPLSVSLASAAAGAFDASMAERSAFSFSLPWQLFGLLVVMTFIGMAALGYQLGFRERPLRALSALLAVMWTLVIVVVADLASARFGSFRTDAAVYEWTRRGFAAPSASEKAP